MNKMVISSTDKELYSLPFLQQAKPNRSFHIRYCFLVVMFLGCILIPSDDQEKNIMNVFFLVSATFLGYTWLATAFFKKPYLKITDEYLEYKRLFGRKLISLKCISQIDIISTRGSKLGILASEQRNFFENGYTLVIPFSIFSNIDFDKLALTITSRVKAIKSCS